MLYKRYFRELKRNPGIYLAIFIILSIGLGTVLGGNAGDDSMIAKVEEVMKNANTSDGYAVMALPINEQALEDEKSLEIEAVFYLDCDTKDGSLRVFADRANINRAYVEDGKLPKEADEVFLEKHYSEEHGYGIGDSIKIGDTTYEVSGIGILPDYIYVLKKSTDMSSHTESFSVAVVSEEEMERLVTEHAGTTTYQYNFKVKKNGDIADAEEFFSNLQENVPLEFVNSAYDPRMITYKEDCAMVKRATMVFAVILLIVIAYVIGVFQKNRVEEERKYIGTLSALGYRRRELILHYTGLPMIIALLGGIGSLACGRAVFSKMLTQDSVDLYSMPDFEAHLSLYIILFAVIVPPLIMGSIGFVMLNKKISDCPDKIIRPAQKNRNVKLNLNAVPYLTAFRMRQFVKEISGNLVMMGGIFVATVLLLLGYSIYSSVDNYRENVLTDVSYDYLYMVSDGQIVPEGAEKLLVQNVKGKSSVPGMNLKLNLYGIEEDSAYFPKVESAEVKEDRYPAVISESLAAKCGLEVGDFLEVKNASKTNTYELEVTAIVTYSNGLSIFMSRNTANEMFDMDETYYNALVSKEKLDGNEVGAFSTTNSSEYEEAAQSMLDSLMLIIIALLGAAVVIYIMVIYLMVKFMMDKAKYNISLLEILGYRVKEVNRIYLGGESFVVLFAILLSLPLGTLVLQGIFPYLTAGYSFYISPYIGMTEYLILACFMFVGYGGIYMYLKRQVRKIEFTYILKERE